MQTRIIFVLYRAFQAGAFPFLLLYALWRGTRDRRYFRRLRERFGVLPPQFQRTVPDSVWLHAVSVGEVLSSVELIRQLRAKLPGAPVFVSCTTLAGRDAAEAKLTALVDGIFYAPVDYVFAVRRVMRRIRPAVLVILETEIWPNLYREIKRAGCALVIVNGRISDRALPKYSRWSWLFRSVLALPDAILAQSEDQRRRWLDAGAPTERVRAAGNLKYDFNPSGAKLSPPLRQWIDRDSGALWVAASTVAPEFEGDTDEDDAVIRAWQTLEGARLLVAPRRPERFDVVAAKMQTAGLRFARRSRLPENVDAPVLLLDSIGELSAVFPHATVVFMGGTLAHRGGHNILEPALCRKPIVVGPHLENFSEIQAHFREGSGFLEIAAGRELSQAVKTLLADPAQASLLGGRALFVAEQERGATARAVDTIVDARWSAVPRRVLHGPVVPLLWLLSKLWLAGGHIKRRIVQTGRLSKPVVSIGGIAMGGAGKTPIVRYLARALRQEGWHPAVLTRGYRRQTQERATVLPAGSSAPVSLTGDEAQTILRDRTAHLGIGADRLIAGRAVEQHLHPDIFLLDDGFQHARMHRDLDVVVLDGMDPFAGGGVFPLGTLREPVSALSRAGVIVIARAEGRRFDGVLRIVRSVNPAAPVLFCETRPTALIEWPGGIRRDVCGLSGRRVGAFCGLGNPQAFRQTLQSLGCDPVFFETYPDHHPYTPANLKHLTAKAKAAEVSALVTTEKDAARLPPLDPAEGVCITYLCIEPQITDLHFAVK